MLFMGDETGILVPFLFIKYVLLLQLRNKDLNNSTVM